jgi:hypothetical protein
LYLDTLAATLARAGKYDQAIQMEQQAIDIALQAGNAADTLTPYQQRLALYKQHRPYLQHQ